MLCPQTMHLLKLSYLPLQTPKRLLNEIPDSIVKRPKRSAERCSFTMHSLCHDPLVHKCMIS